VQRSFDDVGTPLAEVTFVVIDLETTGGSPATSAITEVGAAKFRGGELLGTFQTLVNPGMAIPPEITYLTGITETMVGPAPTIQSVLGPLVEFVGAGVVVGHNVRFDLGFLAAAMDRHAWPRFANPVVDTCALARRLVRDDVPNCRLATLADHFRVAHRPTHRALDDALATAEVLHALLERAGTFGVLGLDDLLALPTISGHPQLSKLRLATRLPRRPGVYLFRDGGGRVLYVGKARDLRRRVRTYFSSDDRRKIGSLLRETAAIDHVVCRGELEATVLEVRLIHEHQPRYNRRTKQWGKYAYLKVTLDERYPRLAVVRAPRPGDGAVYLGPLASSATARVIVDAIHTAVPLRRCTARVPAVPRASACPPAQLGVAVCPCAGTIGADAYAQIVDLVVRGLTIDPTVLLERLAARMRALARVQRFEEAADVRNRAAALAQAVWRQQRFDALRGAGRMDLEVAGEGRYVLEAGVLVDVAASAAGPTADGSLLTGVAHPPGPLPPLAREAVDEVAAVASWLEANATRVRLVATESGWAWPLTRPPRFRPREAAGRSSGRSVATRGQPAPTVSTREPAA
jgi:DNA polymerase-3 subunit epsilon